MQTSDGDTLLARTRALLETARKKGVTNLRIFRDTEIPPNWLSKFANGRIADPSVNRVQALHDYLAGASAQ